MYLIMILISIKSQCVSSRGLPFLICIALAFATYIINRTKWERPVEWWGQARTQGRQLRSAAQYSVFKGNLSRGIVNWSVAHDGYRWIIMLEKCRRPDLNVFHLKWIIGTQCNWKICGLKTKAASNREWLMMAWVRYKKDCTMEPFFYL